MRTMARVYRPEEGHGNGQVQGKSGGIISLIMNGLSKKTSTLNVRECAGIVAKGLDSREKTDILALGSEEC
jgi:hypothetical protein